MWVPVDEVARVAVAGMDANKAVVIPGLPNRIASAFGWLSPRGMLVPMLASRHPGLRT
jgi:short-subunit dehydrogenase